MTTLAPERVTRVKLEEMTHLGHGKRVRLQRLLYGHGPKNGTLLVLPIDQGLEHGPIDFFANPAAMDPDFEFRLALEGNYSAIALHVGLAEKYFGPYAGKVPLILKINGKTNVPPDADALSPLTASVEDAVRLGADAVGYTIYVGSPAQYEDFTQFRVIKEACERYGMPLVVWAYPRGEHAKPRGGYDSLYNVEYAARVACELGADIVKVNYPKCDEKARQGVPAPYDTMDLQFEEAIRRVVKAAGKTFVLMSGGAKLGDDHVLERAKLAMANGASGLIFGRNMWQRPWDQALSMSRRVFDLMTTY